MKTKILWIGAVLACGIVLIVSGFLLLHDQIRSKQEQKAYEQLSMQVQQAKTNILSDPPTSPKEKYADSGVLLQYDALWQQNQHLAGWLSVEGTAINYPVMHTPQEPEYYLRRAFDGTEAVSGSLFLDGSCVPDSNHAIIYGHNMKDGSMFATLPLYESPQYGRDHPEICFDTLHQEGNYQLLAAFYTCADSKNNFPYDTCADLSDPNHFEEYITQVKSSALYDTGIEAEYGDNLLILSTCSYHSANGRFVVVAVHHRQNDT